MAETARLAYHLHWPLDTILDLEHRDRRRFLAEADALAGSVVADGWDGDAAEWAHEKLTYMTDELTPDGEGTPRPSRPAARLARRPRAWARRAASAAKWPARAPPAACCAPRRG